MMKFKKEKYINQRQLKSGWSFQVIIRKDGHTIIETFNEKDYGSAKVAFQCAINYRNRKLTDVAENKYPVVKNIELFEVFEQSEALANLNAKTRRNHASLFARYIGNVPLDKFTPEFIITSLNKMVYDSSNDIISRVFNLCKQIDNTAILKGYYYTPRTIGIKVPKSKKIIAHKKERITDVDTINEILNKCKDRNIKGIIITAYYTGLRPAEIFALSKDDIKNNKLYINKQIGSNLEDEGVLRNTKTDGSTRVVPISSYLKPVLRRFDGPILFKNVDGGYFTSNKFNARTRRLFKSYGFSLYQCRHLFATTLEYAGVDRITIDSLLGHSHRNSTDIYVHTDDEKKENAIDKLGDNFGDHIKKL